MLEGLAECPNNVAAEGGYVGDPGADPYPPFSRTVGWTHIGSESGSTALRSEHLCGCIVKHIRPRLGGGRGRLGVGASLDRWSGRWKRQGWTLASFWGSYIPDGGEPATTWCITQADGLALVLVPSL